MHSEFKDLDAPIFFDICDSDLYKHEKMHQAWVYKHEKCTKLGQLGAVGRPFPYKERWLGAGLRASLCSDLS